MCTSARRLKCTQTMYPQVDLLDSKIEQLHSLLSETKLSLAVRAEQMKKRIRDNLVAKQETSQSNETDRDVHKFLAHSVMSAAERRQLMDGRKGQCACACRSPRARVRACECFCAREGTRRPCTPTHVHRSLCRRPIGSGESSSPIITRGRDRSDLSAAYISDTIHRSLVNPDMAECLESLCTWEFDVFKFTQVRVRVRHVSPPYTTNSPNETNNLPSNSAVYGQPAGVSNCCDVRAIGPVRRAASVP